MLPAPAKEQTNTSTTVADSSQPVVEKLSRQHDVAQMRNAASLVLFVCASAVWLLSFCRMGVSQEGLPWYVTIGIFAAISVKFLKVEQSVISLFGVPQSSEPLKLRESLAICFMVIAVSLYSWVGYRLLHPAKDPPRIAQIVDIQLLSERDYQDNKEQVPGQKPEEDLKARHADDVSQRGSLNISKVFQPKQLSTKEKVNPTNFDKRTKNSNGKAQVEREDEKPAQVAATPEPIEKNILPSNAVPVAMPSTWQTKVIDPHFTPAASRPTSPALKHSDAEPYISEVAPPELVELMDNDGDKDAQHVFQKGGKSSGGKGADNGLSAFMKELHKRIKNNWTPPAGTTRTVEVLFRLKKDGHLAFLKIKQSSGLADTDASATKAVIAAASNGLSLPRDYAPSFLDVMYTFKYNVNELQEVSKGIVQEDSQD